MKRQFFAVLIMILAVCTLGTVVEASPKQFTDVSHDHWAKEEIDFLTGKEIISGYPDGTFGIQESITRAQAASMIMRYFGWNMTDPEDPGYPDLKSEHWAYNDIASLYHLEIFRPTGNFHPNQAVTRAEMADMLVHTFDLFSIKGTKFTDLERDHWAYNSIIILAGSNITAGYPDGTFRPDHPVTRVEFAVFMTRAMDESFRVQDNLSAEGIIYDLEINDSIIQLGDPLLLQNEWLAPLELFERLGFTVQNLSSSKVVLSSNEGLEIELASGQEEVWVGNTSVHIQDPLIQVEGKNYVKAHGILTALEQPLVFYPDQFLIRLETPKITAQDIIAQLPESALHVLHPAQPYWHWTKRDRDHLELLRRNGQASNHDQLIREMAQLMDAYSKIEQEKINVRGLTFFSNELTGKLDALARGLEARYMLLAQSPNYQYPDIGKSTRTSLNSEIYSSIYTVSDHSFMNIAKSSERLLEEISTNTELPFHLFEGLTIHSLPFTILETEPNGRQNAYAGLATGDSSMLVVNAGVHTFFHEFGHNWDFRFGDEDEYLTLRGKTGYVPPTNEWEDRIHENFAEDFAVSFIPAKYGEGVHKASFAMPTDAQKETIREFVFSRSKGPAVPKESVTLNGATFIPDVIYSADGKLHITASTSHHLFANIENMQSGEIYTIDLKESGSNVDQIISLQQQGIYHVQIGGIQTIVVFQ